MSGDGWGFGYEKRGLTNMKTVSIVASGLPGKCDLCGVHPAIRVCDNCGYAHCELCRCGCDDFDSGDLDDVDTYGDDDDDVDTYGDDDE